MELKEVLDSVRNEEKCGTREFIYKGTKFEVFYCDKSITVYADEDRTSICEVAWNDINIDKIYSDLDMHIKGYVRCCHCGKFYPKSEVAFYWFASMVCKHCDEAEPRLRGERDWDYSHLD